MQLSSRHRALALGAVSVGLVAMAWWQAIPGASAGHRRCEMQTAPREIAPPAEEPAVVGAMAPASPSQRQVPRPVTTALTAAPPPAPASATSAHESAEDPIVEGNVDLAMRALDLATLSAADAGDLAAREREYEDARRAQEARLIEARLIEAGLLADASGEGAGASVRASAPRVDR